MTIRTRRKLQVGRPEIQAKSVIVQRFVKSAVGTLRTKIAKQIFVIGK
jgi:hypothetical protein